MNETTPAPKVLSKDSHWLGRCPAKGCKCVIRITVEMRGLPAKTTGRFSHSFTRWVPAAGYFFSPMDLGLHCVTHRRMLGWKPVDGKFSEAHVCDSRCTNAIGPDCNCACGGANHGAGHSVERLFKFAA